MTTDTRRREPRELGSLRTLEREAPPVPRDVPEFLEVTRPSRRGRRTVLLIVLSAVAVLAVAVALLLVRPWESETELRFSPPGLWTGDWKDLVVEEGATVPYTGDWKDLLVD